jgi:ribosomal protein L31E
MSSPIQGSGLASHLSLHLRKMSKSDENEKHPKNVKQVQNRADFSKVNKNDKIRVDPTLIKKFQMLSASHSDEILFKV